MSCVFLNLKCLSLEVFLIRDTRGVGLAVVALTVQVVLLAWTRLYCWEPARAASAQLVAAPC